MLKTEKQIAYENRCRQLLVGQIIRKVIYGEVNYFLDDKENTGHSEPFYHTNDPEIDTVDYGVYLETDHRSVYLFWDQTFSAYGINAKEVELIKDTNIHEQKWDVSSGTIWKDTIGQRIADIQVIWQEIEVSNLNEGSNSRVKYPQTFKVKIENDRFIYMSAAELTDEERFKTWKMADNLLITNDLKLAKQLGIID